MGAAILEGIRLGIKLSKYIRAVRKLRSAPTHSAMVLSPDGNPTYDASILPVQEEYIPAVYTINKVVR